MVIPYNTCTRWTIQTPGLFTKAYSQLPISPRVLIFWRKCLKKAISGREWLKSKMIMYPHYALFVMLRKNWLGMHYSYVTMLKPLGSSPPFGLLSYYVDQGDILDCWNKFLNPTQSNFSSYWKEVSMWVLGICWAIWKLRNDLSIRVWTWISLKFWKWLEVYHVWGRNSILQILSPIPLSVCTFFP